MRALSLFLIFSLLICYGGLCRDGLALFTPSEAKSSEGCHNMNQDSEQTPTQAHDSTINNPVIIASSCCFDSLLNAESGQSAKVDRILVHKIRVANLNTSISYLKKSKDLSQREHDPPDLQISNSTFLL
ncbi:MAG: hypothetical protein RIG61_13240 [Deltaproteobacteria bacterium]